MKKNKFYKCFFFLVAIFATFWVTGFLILELQEGLSVLEIGLLALGVLLFLIIAIGLFRFFQRQVIKINAIEDTQVEFVLLGGETYRCEICDVTEIMRAPSRYVFITREGKRISFYKYSSPTAAFKKQKPIDEQLIRKLFPSAQIKDKIW